jgi:hypothetical protein
LQSGFGTETCSLEAFKQLLASLFDRGATPATFMQANAVYIAFTCGRLAVAPHLTLANFPAIQDFPNTEESKRIASAVRGTVSMMYGHLRPKPPAGDEWVRYFWNRGLELESCEIPEDVWDE